MSADPILQSAVTVPRGIPLSRLRQIPLPGGSSTTGTPAPHRSWNGRDRRSLDRLRRLARDYDVLCTAAVDSAEIAAGLEASGFTDGSAREYGYPGIFGLAEELFDKTPRLADRSPGRVANPWAERPLRHLARGLTFALPGLVLVACLPGLASRSDLLALLLAMLVGWPASQAMAFIGYALEGRRHPRAASALLLLCLCLCLLTAAGFAVVALSFGVSTRIAVVSAGEIAYVTSAAVILVLSHELVVLGALLPGVGAAAWSWLVPETPAWVLVAGAATSVTLVTVVALATCATARPRDVRAGLRVLTGHDFVEVLFHLGYGLAGGALVTLPALDGARTAAGGLALLPVIWSMGCAEWNVVWLRRRSFDLLNETISVVLFQHSVRRLATASTVRYLFQLTTLTAVLVAGIRLTSGAMPSRQLAIALLASWLLGCGFYLALTLSSLSGVRTVVPCLLLAVAVGLPANTSLHTPFAMLAAPLVLVLGLAPALRRTIANPLRHM
jgi:hypothetical protein